jgi:hypothetical protein
MGACSSSTKFLSGVWNAVVEASTLTVRRPKRYRTHRYAPWIAPRMHPVFSSGGDDPVCDDSRRSHLGETPSGSAYFTIDGIEPP